MNSTQLVTNPDGSKLTEDIMSYAYRESRRMHFIVHYSLDTYAWRVLVGFRDAPYDGLTSMELHVRASGHCLSGDVLAFRSKRLDLATFQLAIVESVVAQLDKLNDTAWATLGQFVAMVRLLAMSEASNWSSHLFTEETEKSFLRMATDYPEVTLKITTGLPLSHDLLRHDLVEAVVRGNFKTFGLE